MRTFFELIALRQEQAQKHVIAECFNHQRMHQASFLAWVRHFKSRESEIAKTKHIRALVIAGTRQRLFRLWKEQSWRPLNKIQAVHSLTTVGLKRKAKEILKTWAALA